MTRASQAPALELEQVPEPIRILYVDDEVDDGSMFADTLGKSVDNPVLCFTKAKALFDYLDVNRGPFIIIVDLVMFNDPDLIGGGYEIISLLRQRPDLNETRTPIVAVTGAPVTAHGIDSAVEIEAAQQLMIARVRATGADAFLHKPVRAEDLAIAIGRPGWFRLNLTRNDAKSA